MSAQAYDQVIYALWIGFAASIIVVVFCCMVVQPCLSLCLLLDEDEYARTRDQKDIPLHEIKLDRSEQQVVLVVDLNSDRIQYGIEVPSEERLG